MEVLKYCYYNCFMHYETISNFISIVEVLKQFIIAVRCPIDCHSKLSRFTGEAVRLCGWDIGLAIARSRVQCPVVSVAVTVVSLSKELYSHCSSLPSCINRHISPISTMRTSLTYPEGAVDSERPLRGGGYRKNKNNKKRNRKTCHY